MKKHLHTIVDSQYGFKWVLVQGLFVRVYRTVPYDAMLNNYMTIQIKCENGNWLCMPSWERKESYIQRRQKHWRHLENLDDQEHTRILKEMIEKYAELSVDKSFFGEDRWK